MYSFKKILRQFGRIAFILLASVFMGMISIFPTWTPMRKEDTIEYYSEETENDEDESEDDVVWDNN